MPGCKGSVPEDRIARAAQCLRAGGAVVYPTETLYGLGVDAFNVEALERLLRLKVREAGKPVAVLVDDRRMLDTIVAKVSNQAEKLIERFWPGPLTLVFSARPEVPIGLTGGSGTIGARVSGHPTAHELTRALGRPLTAPSANPAGLKPPVRVEEARAYFDDAVDLYLDDGALPGEPPSTVIDVRDGLRLLRAGAIDFEVVRTSLKPLMNTDEHR
jgi:L-threonylcarbamoyladenylate synthase